MSRRRCHTSRHRGIATITAVFMVAMVGVALVALSSLFTFEARRTRVARAESQLREMLLAGADAGQDLLDRTPADGKPIAIDLPSALQAHKAALTLSITAVPDDAHRTLDVAAEWEQQKARETVTFERSGGKWQAVEAKLVGSFIR